MHGYNGMKNKTSANAPIRLIKYCIKYCLVFPISYVTYGLLSNFVEMGILGKYIHYCNVIVMQEIQAY